MVSKTWTKVGSRRDALVEAMIQTAGSKGYAAASVADVVAAAGSSRATFYKHFAGRLDCFLAAHDLALGRILDAGRRACEAGEGWEARIRAGLRAVLELLSANPPQARVATIEIAAAGVEARRRQVTAIGRLVRLLEAAGPPPLSAPPPPPNAALMAIGAAVGLVFDELRTGDAAALPQLLPELELALFVPYLGPRAAAAASTSPVVPASA